MTDKGEAMSAEKKGPQYPGTRKSWTPRSPVEVMLDQITKQEKKVTELEQALETEKGTLTKLLQAKKILEST
jgi:hypothetical protein